MLNSSQLISRVRPHTRVLPLVNGAAFAIPSGNTRLYFKYRPTGLTQTSISRLHTTRNPLLPTTGTYNSIISPLLYTPMRFYSTNNTDLEKKKEGEKEDPGGFSSNLKKWETKGRKLALPILLKLFPNLLPSTYEWKDKKEQDRAKRLRGNLEMAKFLQETMGEMSLDLKKINAVNADEFIEFMNKVKRNEKVTNKEILTFARLFEDEITLDKISREQLVAMHNYLHGNTISAVKWLSTDYLRTRISNKIEKIKQDDVLIQREGLETMTLDELVDASLVRGMKVEGLNRASIVKQLNSWLDLSLNQNVPPALLILSRAFMMTRTEPAEEALEDTLAHIPEEALKEVVRELPADEVERTQDRLEELAKERAMLDTKNKLEKEEAKKAAETKKIADAKKAADAIKAEEAKKVAAAEEVAKQKEVTDKNDEDAEIKEIKRLDTDVETVKQHSKKIIEEIGQTQAPEAKSPQVLAKKLAGMIQGLEQEIDKIEKEKEEKVKEKKEKSPEKPSDKVEKEKIEDKEKDTEKKGKEATDKAESQTTPKV